MQLLINHLTYSIPNTAIQFNDLNLSFEKRRYGLIGDNGVGKTTLLKLFAGILQPHSGKILINGTMVYCPQYVEHTAQSLPVIEMLGIHEKWQALQRLSQGQMLANDLDIIGDDWGLETDVASLFQCLDLPLTSLEAGFQELSGGQKTKVLLAKSILSKADFILLDEPTNNLDSASKEILIEWIKDNDSGFIIVSHDRALLNRMDEIVNLTTKGIYRFGGNYQFYEEQKAIQQASIEHQITEAKRQLQQMSGSIQTTREQHEQRKKKGRLLRKQGKVDKLTANSMQGRSEKTQSRNTMLADLRMTQVSENLKNAQSNREIKESIHADLQATKVPNNKNVLTIEDLGFAYANQPLLFEHLNLSIVGPERIALLGKNGSGKSTLIQLICGHIKLQQGKIECGVAGVRVLDQQSGFLIPSLNLVENFQQLNPSATIQDAYSALASMQFRNVQAEKKVSDLSGGERIRASLAISLLSKIPPQLIILDEPTNHLDLRSIKAIEEMLSGYQGAMIVISHDSAFLDNIHITRKIRL